MADGEAEGARNVHRSPRRILKGLLYLLICAALTALVVYTPIFTLQRVELNGAAYLKEVDILTITQMKKGEPLFAYQTDALQKTLMKDLRIESAVVRRRFPDALEIDIVERRPIATIACDYGYLDFDRTGKVLSGYRALKGMAIPLITGTEAHDLYIGDDNSDPVVARVLDFLARLDDGALAQISEVNVKDPAAIAAYTTGAVQIRLGILDKVEEKADLTNGFIDSLKTARHAIEFVDFSYDAPFIRLKEMPQEPEKKEDEKKEGEIDGYA